MKRVSIRLIIALLTFALGVIMTISVWIMREPVSVPSPLAGATYDADYSELELNPERYVGESVRLKVRMYVDCKGSIYEGRIDAPVDGRVTFFGSELAADSAESLASARGSGGVDPEDPECKFDRARDAQVTVVGEFRRDSAKTDFMGRTYPYWLIVHHLEGVEVTR